MFLLFFSLLERDRTCAQNLVINVKTCVEFEFDVEERKKFHKLNTFLL
jgi:hypothetical protein